MKKNYQKPTALIASMNFAEHITAASGEPVQSGDCGWSWHDSEADLGGDCHQNAWGSAEGYV